MGRFSCLREVEKKGEGGLEAGELKEDSGEKLERKERRKT